MADHQEELTNQIPSDHPLKRKLDDIESNDVAPPDSSPAVDGEGDVTRDVDVNGGDVDDNVKRPRFDEATDRSASANGLKSKHDDEENAEKTEELENTEATSNAHADGSEQPNEAVTEEGDGVQPGSETDPKVDGENDVAKEGKDAQASSLETEQPENVDNSSGGEHQEPGATELAEQRDGSAADHVSENGMRTRRIEIPNNKVGVLIGKAGDTIKYLQINSGAKIQITRDADADPRAPMRPVELIGSLESLNKAEKLIKDVIAEADAGGSPSLVARGFTATATGSVEIEMLVASDKVGLIIGKGGETIRNLQTRSGARIQLIPQSSLGDQSKEKKVKVTGDKRQVETARELIKEVMNQPPGRQSQFSSNYNQQPYHSGGPGGAPQWGPRGPQPMPYDYHHQRGPYPSQNQPYPAQSYGNYPPQGHPRGGFGSGWEQRPPAQGPPPQYYGQGGGHGPNAPSSAPQPTHVSGHASGQQPMGPRHSHPNYNYGQPAPYSQMAPPAQNYNQGYGEPKYDGQGQIQQPFGGSGYGPQQHYARPPQGGSQQGYAPPAASQPVNTGYQAPASASQPYAQNVQAPQQYPYASGAMTQAPYGSAPVVHDGYAQPQAAMAGYPQQGAQSVGAYGQQAAAGYNQAGAPTTGYNQAGAPTTAYNQAVAPTTGYNQAGAPTTGYSQYPSVAQPGYTDASAGAAASTASYGYQAQVDPSAAYGAGLAYNSASAAPQQGHAQPQPVTAQPGYDQSAVAAQSGGYASAPTGAPPAAAYGKTVSPQPQPGYPQYDASQQMYAAPR